MTTPAPRWRRRPESRRDELLDAAQHLFVTNGLESTTVADIVAAAGLAKGSFYRYFASKDDLFAALKGRLFDRMDEQMMLAVLAVLHDSSPAAGAGIGCPALCPGTDPGDPARADDADGAGPSPDPNDVLDDVLTEVLAAGAGRFGAVTDALIAAAITFLFAEAELIGVWSSHVQTGSEPELVQGIDHLAGFFEQVIIAGVGRGVLDCPYPAETARFLVFAVEMTTTRAILDDPAPVPRPDRLIAAAQLLARRALGLTG